MWGNAIFYPMGSSLGYNSKVSGYNPFSHVSGPFLGGTEIRYSYSLMYYLLKWLHRNNHTKVLWGVAQCGLHIRYPYKMSIILLMKDY